MFGHFNPTIHPIWMLWAFETHIFVQILTFYLIPSKWHFFGNWPLILTHLERVGLHTWLFGQIWIFHVIPCKNFLGYVIPLPYCNSGGVRNMTFMQIWIFHLISSKKTFLWKWTPSHQLLYQSLIMKPIAKPLKASQSTVAKSLKALWSPVVKPLEVSQSHIAKPESEAPRGFTKPHSKAPRGIMKPHSKAL